MKPLLAVFGAATALLVASTIYSILWQQAGAPGELPAFPAETTSATTTASTGESADDYQRGSVTAENFEAPRGDRNAADLGDAAAAARLKSILQRRLDEARRRERQLAQRQELMELIYEDIRGEKMAVDRLHEQLDRELRAGQLSGLRLATRAVIRPVTSGETPGTARSRHSTSGHTANVGETTNQPDAPALETMVAIVRQMASGGRTDAAVNLLHVMKEREAARILAAIPETDIADQIILKLQQRKREAQAAQ